jgi:enoyl-CoA hydratase/carnithine racemase
LSETVLSKLDQGIRTITLNRPDRLNAMNVELVSSLADRFAEANADPETRVIIFTGAGRAFCAGDDLKERRHPATAEEAQQSIEEIQRVTHEIFTGDKFVVGAINGWAVGGGFEWAINCDLPIWAESARGFFPEMYWGAFVTGGVTAILPRIVGLTRAKEMILLGDKYTARELLEAGLAWRVVADDQLLDEARAVAARIAALPQRSVIDLKRVMNKAAFSDVQTAQTLETEATVRAFLDPETTERIAGFEK